MYLTAFVKLPLRQEFPFAKTLRIMKLITLFIFVFCLQVSARTYSQKITISGKNISLEKIFRIIERQTNYVFFFDEEGLQLSKPVTIDIKKASLTEALTLCFNDQPLAYSLVGNTIVITKKDAPGVVKELESIPAPQMAEIKGRVTDEEGKPMAGVSVIVKGTKIGTTTDAEGNYTINVPDNSSKILVFSSVGAEKREVALNGNTNITVTLKATATDQQEVVVVGYGTQKKVNLTGSVSTVSAAELVKRPVSNVANLLQGKVTGLQVTQEYSKPGAEGNTLRIRGLGTFGAGNDPLVMIDGIAGDMSNLDPNDVESVSVLKDAASGSIYGARAANGVILITTKRGKSGQVRIDYSGNIQAQKATRLPDLLYNSADYMQYWNEGRIRAGGQPYFTQAEIDAYRNNTNDPVNYPNFNWMDHAFRTAIANNHYINVSGGSERTTFNLSLGYLDQDGITSTYGYKKYNLLVSVDSKVNDWITVGGQIRFVKKDIQKSNWDNDVDYQILAIYGAAPNYTPTKVLPDGTTGYIARYGNEIGEWTVRNPDAQDASGIYNQNYYNIIPQVYTDIKLTKNLSWYTKVSATLDNSFGNRLEHAVNNYYFNDGSFAHNNSTWRLGVEEEAYQTMYLNLYSTLKYNKTFGTNHTITVLGGYNQEYNKYQQLFGSKITFPSPDLRQLNAGADLGQITRGTANEWGIQSFFGRINYDYKNKYLLEANARYDGTSRISPDNRWGVFPSISAGWRISEEAFLQDASLIQNLKLRGSWGKLGNQNIGIYPYQDVLSTTSYPFSTAYPGVIKNRMVDKNLKWESTTITDIGLDIGLKEGLFTATVDWFNKVTDDILYQIPIPASVGLSSPTVNYGKMKNTGIEIQVGHGKQFGDFRYDVNLNYTRVRNEVLRILAPSYGNTTIQEGLPFNSFYLIEMDGIFQNQAEIDNSPTQSFNPKPGDLKFKDQNKDGKIDADDRVVVPGAMPKFYYGGTINLRWKGLDLSAFFQGVAGQKSFSQGLGWGLVPYIQGSPPTNDFIKKMWTGEGSTNKDPAMYISGYAPVTGTPNTYFLLDAAYLRLKNLSIGYTVPRSFTQKIRLQSLRIYASGDNLFTITKYPGADPEKASTGWFTAYPQITIYTFGIKASL